MLRALLNIPQSLGGDKYHCPIVQISFLAPLDSFLSVVNFAVGPKRPLTTYASFKGRFPEMNELRRSEKSHETRSMLPDGEKALVSDSRARVPHCHRTLYEAKTLSKRTEVTLTEVIKVTHTDARCQDMQCPGHQRMYRESSKNKSRNATVSRSRRTQEASTALQE
jgi:hypothetical protein